MKNKMIKAAIGVRCVSCFVGPPATFLASPATLNRFDNSVVILYYAHMHNIVIQIRKV